MQLMRPRRPWLVKYGILALLAMALITLVACVSSDIGTVENRDSRGAKILATAQATVTGTPLAPTITGNISLEETTAGLAMRGTFDNVPAGMHGFHIHEGDSCAEDGKAAGGHFNPRDVQHGHLPSTGVENAHAGDLGNLQGSDHTTTDWSLEVTELTLTPGEFSVANRPFIIHADPDDLSQPTGNAGARIACGVIALK
ncbi:MAG: superoxide dismutase family protein [Cyanobacteria bacterium J06634_5]